MCSVPGLPTPGSQVTVFITKVNLNPICALVELFGNFDQERRNDYQQMKKEIQIPTKMFCKSSEGNPGDLCLAHLNETWHRARIKSRDEQHYNVFLIDEGITQVASSNTLAWGQNHSFILPPEVEFCVLANVSPLSNDTKWTQSASDFFKSLCGKTFNGMVQDVLMLDRTVILYIPSVNQHMYDAGFAKHLPSDIFKQLVLSFLNLPKSEVLPTKESLSVVSQEQTEPGRTFKQYYYPELLTGSKVTVEVTEVINPHRIFCRLSIFSQELKKLSEQLNEYYRGRLFPCKERPQTSGTPCTARKSNGNWCRSLLQQDIGLDSTVVEVLHVDNGKKDFVHVDDIRLLAAKFLKLPVVTYVCSLEGIQNKGIGWKVDEIEYLKSLLLHQTVFANFQYQDLNMYCVTVYGMDHVNINKIFKEKIALLESEGTPTQVKGKIFATDMQDHVPSNIIYSSAKVTILSEQLLQVGSVLDVKVFGIESPAKFWCQMVPESSSLKILMQELQIHYATIPPQQVVEDICVALNPDDGMWYRARIIKSSQLPQVDVRYIDYGTTRKVSLKDLRPLDPLFRGHKTQAFQCFLQNLKNPTSAVPMEWSDAASFEFQKFVDSNIDLKCYVNAVIRDTQGFTVHMVDIRTEFQSISELLFQQGIKAPALLNTSPEPPKTYTYSLHNIEVGTKEKVWITSIKSIFHFYGQLERNSGVIDKLTKDLQHICQQLKQNTNCPQSLEAVCIAKYTDMQWYRGQIKAIHPIIQVHFVDYGNTVAVNQSNILSWPEEAGSLMSVPVQAVPFGLYGVPGDVSQKVNRWFEHATDRILTFKIVAKDSCGKLLIELYDGTTPINEEIRKKQKEERLNTEHVLVQQFSYNSKVSTTFKLSDPFQKELVLPEIVQITSDNLDAMETVVNNSDAKCFTSPQCTLQSQLEHQPDKKSMAEHGRPMCSIPKLSDLPLRPLKQGLVTEVQVSHVNSPSSFFIQITKDYNDFSVVDKLVSQSSCDDLSVDFNKLQLGDLVNVQHPDNTLWYRAAVRHKPENGKVHVEFVDLGNEATVPSMKVKQLKKQCLEYPRFSVHCVLGGITSTNKETWGEEVALFKKVTTGNGVKKLACTFIREIGSVWEVSLEDDGILLAHYLIKCSQTVRADASQPSFSGENTIPLLYKKPGISKNQSYDAYASCITGPNYFWCQHANSEELDRIVTTAQKFGNSELHESVLMGTLISRSPCLVLFAEDNQWYRAQIIHKTENLVNVLFVDYGNESEVDVKAIRSMPPLLLESAPQAFLCTLDGFDQSKGAWNNNAVDGFYQLLVDKLLKVTVQNMEDNLKYATPQYQVKVECEEYVINDLMGSSWCCSDLQVITETLDCTQEVSISNETLNWSEYKCLTKETILKWNSTELSVMDGNSSAMQHLEDNSTVRRSYCENLERVSGLSNVLLKGVHKCQGLPTRSINPGWVADVYISHYNSPTSFFVQLVEDENNLFSLVERLNPEQSDAVTYRNVANPQPGDLVNSEFPGDSSWYRAVILETIGENMVHVQYIDYGNEAKVSTQKVFRLDADSLEQPRLSIHCSLGALPENQDGDLEQEVFLFKGLVGSETQITCKFIQETGSNWVVCLMDQNIIQADSLKECCLVRDSNHLDNKCSSSGFVSLESNLSNREYTTQLQFQKPNIFLGQSLDVYTSSIGGPGYFWCQKAYSEELPEILRLCKEIGNAKQKETILGSTLTPGSPCLALFAEDEQWYRAQIIKCDNVVSVIFVDYGNESEVDVTSLKSIPLQLLECPPQAFLCSLNGFESSKGSWNDNAFDEFYELVTDKMLKLTIQNIENSELSIPQFKVNAECEKLIVNDLMKKCWRSFLTESQSEDLPEYSWQLEEN